MRSRATCFDELRQYLETVPLVDCHDHSAECGPYHEDPLQAVVCGYFISDLWSASGDADIARMQDKALPLEQRWPILEKAWKRTCHTGYAEVVRRVLKRFYGESELTLETLRRIQRQPLDLRDPAAYENILEEARIAVRLENLWLPVEQYLNGTAKLTPRSRVVISLPEYHGVRDFTSVQARVAPLKRNVTSLDEYVAACRAIFEGLKRFGAVAFKDQCAYSRTLAFGNPPKAEAEAVFNWLAADPRRAAAYPDGVKPLDDYLFHEFMRMARDLDLPVQIHTGHMAGIRNDIVKANAASLTSLLELHRDVRFDLFHANWPYSAEILYLGKNYPNVTIDFCWANIIDPIYCQRLFQQVLSAVPHGKIHAYGSDLGGDAAGSWAHAQIARDNVAIALADLVEGEYLGLDEAREVAWGWLFGNANAFFRLGIAAEGSGHRPGKPGVSRRTKR
jgi:hypothetical protein